MLFFFSEEIWGGTKTPNDECLSLHITPKKSQFGIQSFLKLPEENVFPDTALVDMRSSNTVNCKG